LWSKQSSLTKPEWWATVVFAGIGVVVNPILDVTQFKPNPVAGIFDSLFCIVFVVAARWPWISLAAYVAFLGCSFIVQEQVGVLFAMALSVCMTVRVGSIRCILALATVLGMGLLAVLISPHSSNGAGILFGIPFIALVSAALGAILRLAFGREVRLTTELRQRAQAEQEIRDNERQLIGDELHDYIAHDLTVIATYVSVVEAEETVGDTPDRRHALALLGDMTRKVLDDLRLVMQHESAIEGQTGLGLPTAFEEAERELTGAGLRVRVEGDPADPRITRLRSTALARVLREAVTNILKHGGQSPIEIRLSILDDVIHFDIRNALPHGYVESSPPSRGFGTIRISERVRQLGGQCVIGQDGDTWGMSVSIPLHPLF